MTIKIGNSSIKRIQLGSSIVKSAYLGSKLVYGSAITNVPSEPSTEIDPTYNYYVFDTSLDKNGTKVILKKYRAGDTTEWDGLTDWGDGTIDSNISHTYVSDGIYTVKTKHMINNDRYYDDNNTRKMLIECICVNNNITNMDGMFYGCTSLTLLDLSNFDNGNVTTMREMLYNCTKLISLNLSNFNTSKVTTMYGMFSYCRSLTSLNVSNFDTSNVNNMAWMFYSCTS